MASEKYILVRPPQLPELANVQAGAYVVGYNTATDQTVKINVSTLGGGQETDINWRANVPYATGLIVEYGLKLWKSLIDDNLGNLPSEGANWTEVSKAGAGSNITNYTTGVYTHDPTIVLLGGRMYYLLAAKPFESTDFIAELEANQWREINRNNIIGVAYNNLIGSDYYFPNLDDTLIVLTAGTIGIENGNETVFSLTITEPSYVIRTGTGYTAGDFTILPIGGGGGGHTILDPDGNTMPTQPALQFGAGFTVTDEVGKTVVERDVIEFDDIAPAPDKGKKLAKVKDDGTGLDYTDYGYDEVVQKAQTFNEGTLKKFDVNGNDVDSGLTGESLDIYAISPSLISALTNESNWRDGGGNPIVGGVAFASGIKGQRYYSDEFFYECIADNNWVRTYTGRPVINIYDNSALTLVFKGYLEDSLNWVGKIYIGPAITGVAQGTRHYDNDYVYEFFQTNVPIRYSRD